MKKTILILTMVVSGFASFSFANTPTRTKSNPVVASFKNDFTNAQEVTWEDHSNFLKASFVENGQFLYAYYTTAGNLIAISRNISPSQLTMNAQQELKTNFAGYWITELFEISADHETSYYVTLENASQKVVLKSAGADAWEVYQKEVKQ